MESHRTDPLVSVVIPTYNRRDLVTRAIESVFAQTYRNFEVIVVDDGSTDGTREAVLDLPGPVSYYAQDNRGVGAARNTGVENSSGELVALLDSDDWWRPEKLRRCVRYLQKHPQFDLVYTPMATFDENGRELKGRGKPCREGYLLNELFEDIFIHDPTAVFWRRVWEAVGGFNGGIRVCVGHDFFLRAAVNHRFGVIREPLAARTWSPNSLTHEDRVLAHEMKVKVFEEFYERHRHDPRLSPERARRALARTYYAAGKTCARNGRLGTGLHFLGRALSYRPFWPKARAFQLWTLTRWNLQRGRRLLSQTAASS